MSTFLVTFGVVAATIAAVVYVVLNGPDQPPTIRQQPSRAEARKRRRKAVKPAPPKSAPPATPSPPIARPPALVPTGPALALPDSDMMRLRVLPARRTTLWVRVRSGVVLVILVALLGAILALVIGGVGVGLAFLIRGATG